MKPPQNKKKLETFLGVINYLCKFLLHLPEETYSMRNLLKDKAGFVLYSNMENVFQRVKAFITAVPVLVYCNVTKDVQIQADVSQYGLVAVLLQEGIKNCEKFHQCINGK